jgi:hypothetical protein
VYVLVRTDLSLPQQLCQAAHAAHESGRHLADRTPAISSIVLCALPSERALLDARDRLEFLGIRTVVFREPDLGGQATALATEPVRPSHRPLLSRYPLWKGA